MPEFVNTYKLLAGTPLVVVTQQSGTAYASHTGSPNKRGRWRVQIQNAPDSLLAAHVIEIESCSDYRIIPVASSRSYTTLIPGLTITLSTIAAGNYFDVDFSKLVPDEI
jgi:hypothetical protein